MSHFPPGPLALKPLALSRLPEEPFVWNVPGSKSITNRALMLAALAPGQTLLRGVLHSDDTRHMRQALEQLGIGIEDVDATTWRVHGGRERLRVPERPLFVGNSGTTVRFLTALCALVPGPVTLEGDEHMAKRPIGDLVAGLQGLGVEVECPSGCPPLTVFGGRLPGGRTKMPGDKSSQYFSALLMAAPAAEGPIEIEVEGSLVSRPYVDITLAMMRSFGAQVSESPGRFTVTQQGYRPLDYAIEPDASAASYAFGCAAVTGLSIVVPHLGQGALQGDYRFVDVLERGGADVLRAHDSTMVRGTGTWNGQQVDMHHISDTVMTLAALAPLAQGPTQIDNVYNIRIKETDRLEATVNELTRLGQHVESGRDWLRIQPRGVAPCVVRSYSDHRMAMAFSLLGLCRPGVQIEEPACVAKTYPGFFDDLAKLYAHCGQRPPY